VPPFLPLYNYYTQGAKIKSINSKYLLTALVLSSLTACGGGGGSSSGTSATPAGVSNSIELSSLAACGGGGAVGSSSETSTMPAVVSNSITANPHSTATPLANINYQAIRNLAGTGIGQTLAPSDVLTHYSFPSTLTGAGQTIAIVDAPGSVYGAAIETDLNTFSTYYKLPTCTATNACFKQIDLSNGAKVVAKSTSDWMYEVALDTQWAHAMAPAAAILLITAKSNAITDLLAAVQTAAAQPNVVAISMSFGGPEFSAETGASYDGILKTIQASGIILFASAGDSGNNGTNQEWPAASPYVTTVGGTSITTVAYNLPSVTTEVAWADGGGGASLCEAKPAFQTSSTIGATVTALDPTKRAIPDIAYNAAPYASPVSVVIGGGWYGMGGTSAGPPQWAAIAALIAQDRATKKETTLQTLMVATPNGFNGFLYQAKVDSTGLFDVTMGSDDTSTQACAICNAGAGYSAVTGFGVPNVNNILTFF